MPDKQLVKAIPRDVEVPPPPPPPSPLHSHPEGHFHILPSPDLHLVVIGTDVLKVGLGDGEQAAGKRRRPGETGSSAGIIRVSSLGEAPDVWGGKAGGRLPSEASYFTSSVRVTEPASFHCACLPFQNWAQERGSQHCSILNGLLYLFI